MNLEDIIIEKHIRCPLSNKIFKNPVVASDGFTYEKENIQEYLRNNPSRKSPITDVVIINDVLIENLFVKHIVTLFLKKYPDDDTYDSSINLMNCFICSSSGKMMEYTVIDKAGITYEFNQLLDSVNEMVSQEEMYSVRKEIRSNTTVSNLLKEYCNSKYFISLI